VRVAQLNNIYSAEDRQYVSRSFIWALNLWKSDFVSENWRWKKHYISKEQFEQRIAYIQHSEFSEVPHIDFFTLGKELSSIQTTQWLSAQIKWKYVSEWWWRQWHSALIWSHIRHPDQYAQKRTSQKISCYSGSVIAVGSVKKKNQPEHYLLATWNMNKYAHIWRRGNTK